MKTFMERYVAGEAVEDDIDDDVDRWHDGEGGVNVSLAAFLGMTENEYRLWVWRPGSLPAIRAARVG